MYFQFNRITVAEHSNANSNKILFWIDHLKLTALFVPEDEILVVLTLRRCSFCDGGSRAFLNTTAEQDYFPLNSTMADIVWNSRGFGIKDTYSVMCLAFFFVLSFCSDEHAVSEFRGHVVFLLCWRKQDVRDETLYQRKQQPLIQSLRRPAALCVPWADSPGHNTSAGQNTGGERFSTWHSFSVCLYPHTPMMLLAFSPSQTERGSRCYVIRFQMHAPPVSCLQELTTCCLWTSSRWNILPLCSPSATISLLTFLCSSHAWHSLRRTSCFDMACKPYVIQGVRRAQFLQEWLARLRSEASQTWHWSRSVY